MTRLVSISLACLLLFSSLGLVLSSHFCGGQRVNTAIFGKAASCCAKMTDRTCTPPAKDQICRKDCCQDQLYFLQATTDKVVVAQRSMRPVSVFALALASLLFADISPASCRASHHLVYKPPLILADRPVLYQSFLL